MLLSYKRQYPAFLYGNKSQVDPDISKANIANEFKHLSFDIDSANVVSWMKTAKEIAAFDPDIVILPWWVAYWAPMYIYLMYFLKKKNINTLFICINVFEHENSAFKKFLTGLVIKRADSVIVHSEQEKREVLELNPKSAVRKHLLPLFEYASGK